MNRTAFLNWVANLKGAHFVTIRTETKLKMNKFGLVNGEKKPNPYLDKIIKSAKLNGQINFDFSAGVNRLRDKQAGTPGSGTSDFKAGKDPWSGGNQDLIKHGNNSVIQNGDKYYLQIRPIKWLGKEYFFVNDNGTRKLLDEKFMKEFVKPYLPPEREKDDSKIDILRYNLDNIKSVTVDKTSHIFELALKKIVAKVINEILKIKTQQKV